MNSELTGATTGSSSRVSKPKDALSQPKTADLNGEVPAKPKRKKAVAATLAVLNSPPAPQEQGAAPVESSDWVEQSDGPRSPKEAARAFVAAQSENTPEVKTEVAPLAEGEVATAFNQLPLSKRVLDVLDENGFQTPTPIQAQAIPVVMTGSDLIGIAQTGTGKTLAFGLPILDRIATKTAKGRALILVPTRELALQVEEALWNLGRAFRLRTAVFIGGAPARPQLSQMRGNPDIIVATPGRLNDFLANNQVDLRAVDCVVLDEADRMLDMGFAPQIRRILSQVPTDRQTLLFSATMPDEIVNLTREFQRDPQRVEIERAGTTAENITQNLYIVEQDDKPALLEEILSKGAQSVLIFARTRSRANKVSRYLNGLPDEKAQGRAAEIHSDRTLGQRRQALDGFKSGRYRVLVATDIAARGIDVTGIELVINFDLPDAADDYVHRIGRTARAGRSGTALSFAAPDQWRDVRDIEKSVGNPIPLAEDNRGEFPPASRPRTGGGASRGGRSNSRPRGGGGGNRSRDRRY
jgi:ATP-dependent RNA helicase RhlE